MKSYGRTRLYLFQEIQAAFFDSGVAFAAPIFLERTDNMKKYEAIPVSGRWKRYSIPSMILTAIPHHVHTDGVVRGVGVCGYALGEPPSPFCSLTGHF